ncbi:MAG: hypothetical protein HFH39_10345 [Lachnospiraceae bacterium]|nr:hypothetical protein [Lachnospiraceae bacterium]
MSRYLMMIEASQKQAFIFRNKRLANNIYASHLIQYITSEKCFQEIAPQEFAKGSVVYNGGGHTVLEFCSRGDAKAFAQKLTKYVIEQFRGLEVFVKIYEYNKALTPEENEKKLTQMLEEKKARRETSFCQQKFGIEAMGNGGKERDLSEIYKLKEKNMAVQTPIEEEIQELLKDYTLVHKFQDLGGTKEESNFIAVVHIDGNLMGKRVGELAESIKSNMTEKTEKGWEDYKQTKHNFSEAIDHDFKKAYYDMLKSVIGQIDNGMLLDKLSLQQKDGKYCFPVRDIILAGDDICFVTEGRIGVACAVAYLKSIWKQVNGVDQKNYSACAGVAIVHQKYPFYRAYELAEELCSNAKRMIAQLDPQASANVCAIDWHISYGEMENGLSQIRRQYQNREGGRLEMRPYLVCGDAAFLAKENIRRYEHFEGFITSVQEQEIAARGKLKSLRAVLKDEERTGVNYLKSNLLEDMVWQARECYELKEKDQSEKLFYQTFDGEKRNMLFDAIELADTYITW